MLEKIKIWLLKLITKFIVGEQLFVKVQQTVEKVAKKNISGKEKRDIAIKELKEVGNDFAEFTLNFALETAVFALKSKQKN